MDWLIPTHFHLRSEIMMRSDLLMPTPTLMRLGLLTLRLMDLAKPMVRPTPKHWHWQMG